VKDTRFEVSDWMSGRQIAAGKSTSMIRAAVAGLEVAGRPSEASRLKLVLGGTP
jgi:hypothetical protein